MTTSRINNTLKALFALAILVGLMLSFNYLSSLYYFRDSVRVEGVIVKHGNWQVKAGYTVEYTYIFEGREFRGKSVLSKHLPCYNEEMNYCVGKKIKVLVSLKKPSHSELYLD